MVTKTETIHAGAYIVSEANGFRSRGAIKIPENQSLVPGQILGKVAVPADVVATASAAGGNTGDATIAMDVTPVTAKVKNGRYKGIAVTATTVRWEDPDGNEIGTSTHGTLFNKGGVRLTITAGGVANVAGDEFFVDVTAEHGDYVYPTLNLAGTDGSEVPSAIAMYPATTGAGETELITGHLRDCEVRLSDLTFPAGATADQQAAVVAALADLGIIAR
ncbi:head decoration protein [Chelatococcus daeguensis]|uniref:Bacteriophage lambda head decoration protein D n=1 Tax=Chelatococcus sambhunathii TaxID=363953 RepID=A0ABM9UD00_9HYPH|nr:MULTISPECIES: head decoration protein [Chelatococcus]KZE34107.1 hypothetical protein AVW15_17485 [Chelatococcus daeguensis]MBM3082664.1 head decoration protein [Chelatococcus daeguensis]CUA90908.1 Bacteriophage lambda head decoration protein D [Chelatococcus sambhunathii]